MNLQESIGKRISFLRKEKELSQQRFADEAAIDRSHLAHIEIGKKNISLSTLGKILDTLNISPRDFFNSNEFTK